MKRLVLLITLLFSSSCARQADIPHEIRLGSHGQDQVISQIRIKRWGEVSFSGMLALQKKGDRLAFVVLDPTGVTLLGREIPIVGQQDYIVSTGALKDTAIADYLTTAFTRMFILEPDEKSCSGQMIRRFCWDLKGDKEQTTMKKMKVGPFTSWVMEQRPGNSDSSTIAVYTQPWIGLRIELEGLDDK